MADPTIRRMTAAEYEAEFGVSPFSAAGVHEALAGQATDTTPGRVFAGGMGNLLNALTFGFGDEAVAGTNALIDAVVGGLGYDERLKEFRDMRSEFRQEAGPALSIAHDIGSGFLNPVGLPKKAQSLSGAVANAAKSGGLLGALFGFGESEGGVSERAIGAGYGGAVGAGSGALITSALKGGSDILEHFTESGRKAKAGEILREVAGQEGASRVLAYADDSHFGPRTFAEVAQTPNAAAFEQQMRKEMGDGNEIMAALAERQANRANAIRSIVPDEPGTVTPDVRGSSIRESALPVQEAADKAHRTRWNRLTGTGRKFNATIAMDPILAAESQLADPRGFSPATRKILDAVKPRTNDKGEYIFPRLMTVDEYQRIRSAAGEEFANAASQGRNREAALLATVRDSLDQAATVAAAEGGPSKTIKGLQKAIEGTRKYQQKFGADAPKAILAKGEGGFRLGDSQVPSRILRSPEAAKSFVRAFGKDPDVMAQARGALIDDITKGNPDTWVKAFNRKRPQARAILGDHFNLVAAVMKNLDSELSVGRLAQQATGRGSITSQGITATDFLKGKTEEIKKLANAGTAMVFGQLAGYGAGGGAGTVAGGLLGLAAGQSMARAADTAAKQIRALVVRGLRDPEFAKQLLATKGRKWPASSARALSRIAGQQAGIQSGLSFSGEGR